MFKGTNGTGAKDLFVFEEVSILFFRPPVVPLRIKVNYYLELLRTTLPTACRTLTPRRGNGAHLSDRCLHFFPPASAVEGVKFVLSVCVSVIQHSHGLTLYGAKY